eukprot:TRINITY_DN1813_c0_g1_i4.p1 TRINITY_DN1813_c0_g1~~TRINITY_DN1813_c0_g1_i4.p1  ORF type:complete len:324 (+),score=90.53 TRINITY_DN1813_c0_g1_i4:36-974(+)
MGWFSYKFYETDIPQLDGKVAIVTGGSGGIGKETVRALADHGAKVYMGARSEQKAKEAIEEIEQKTGKKVEFLQMDLTSLESIKGAIKEFLTKETELHLLINNAGVMATPYEFTKDGYELQWGTNVVGHFAVTKLLLPTLLSTAEKSKEGDVRVINVSSAGHAMAPSGGIHFDDLKLENFSTWTRYGQSKLGNILLTNALTERYKDKGLYSLSLHPGVIKTNLFETTAMSKDNKFLAGILNMLGNPFMMTPENGALNQLYAATSPEVVSLKLNGAYLTPVGNKSNASSYGRDAKLADRMWQYLEEEMKNFHL